MLKTRLFPVLALLLGAVLMTGCIKLKQVVTVMPDGSGKIDYRIGMSQQLIDMAKQQGEDPFADLTPDKIGEGAEGIVAYTKPERSKDGAYTYISFTAYFRDINEVQIEPMSEGNPTTYAYTREGDIGTLVVSSGITQSIIAEQQPMEKEEKAMMRQMAAGLEFIEGYVMPGEIKPVEGLPVDGRAATITITLDNLLDGTGPLADMKNMGDLVLEVPAISMDQAAQDAFKQELEAAVTAWEAMKNEQMPE